MRHITEVGLRVIQFFETFSPKVYICPAGYETIYWGHLVHPGEVYDGTEEQGLVLLKKDLWVAEDGVLRLVKVPLTDGQFDALASFAFNLGTGALQRSTLRSKLNRKEYQDAAQEFLKWVRAKGRILKGLVKRRQAEQNLFLFQTPRIIRIS